jgi:hypothetical protein
MFQREQDPPVAVHYQSTTGGIIVLGAVNVSPEIVTL